MMSTSVIMDREGTRTHCPCGPEERPFFRKYVDTELGDTELFIADRIMKSSKPLTRVATIFDVHYGRRFYDAELLDCCVSLSRGDILTDVSIALNQLHALNIVYIDLKSDNVGYSHKDRCWKLFDFDVSGVEEKGEWVKPPPLYYNYQRARLLLPSPTNLYQIDEVLFKHVFQKEIECALPARLKRVSSETEKHT